MAGEAYLDAGMTGWIANMARKELWRMPKWYTYDDLYQDGYMCYAKCCKAYPQLSEVAEPNSEQRRWFMALVQTTFNNHIMTLAGKAARGEDIPTLVQADPDLPGEKCLEQSEYMKQSEEASLLTALVNAPAELRDVIARIVKDGLDGGEYLRSYLRRDGNRLRWMSRSHRETTDQYWERVLGQRDVPQKLAAYLRGQEADCWDGLERWLNEYGT